MKIEVLEQLRTTAIASICPWYHNTTQWEVSNFSSAIRTPQHYFFPAFTVTFLSGCLTKSTEDKPAFTGFRLKSSGWYTAFQLRRPKRHASPFHLFSPRQHLLLSPFKYSSTLACVICQQLSRQVNNSGLQGLCTLYRAQRSRNCKKLLS